MADSLSRQGTSRLHAVLYGVGVLLVGGLYSVGYVMGARAPHPNSPWTMAAFVVVAAFLATFFGLWQAASPKESS